MEYIFLRNGSGREHTGWTLTASSWRDPSWGQQMILLGRTEDCCFIDTTLFRQLERTNKNAMPSPNGCGFE